MHVLSDPLSMIRKHYARLLPRQCKHFAAPCSDLSGITFARDKHRADEWAGLVPTTEGKPGDDVDVNNTLMDIRRVDIFGRREY